jgi:three-Cys-motif partner protein
MYEPVDNWTSQRVAFLKRYLCAFTTAATKRAHSTAFIDAFAGADYCAESDGDSRRLAGFPVLAEAGPKALLKCSSRAALTTNPAFDGYVFIERSLRRCRVLEALAHEFADRNLQIRRTDVNRELRRISHLDWSTRRAVLFVDAYAASLDWDTVVEVSRTKATDIWLLFPVGFAANPAANGSAFPPRWRDCLNQLLQTDEWFKRLEGSERHADARLTVLSQYLTRRLNSTFANVSRAGVMRTASGAPLYVLCFASAAPGLEGTAALELAEQLLETSDV